MSVALFIVPEQKIEGFDHSVNGKFIGRERDSKIDNLCKSAGVKSLYEFCSQAPDELADLVEYFDGDVPDNLPTEEFFEATEGLVTVQGMLKTLESGDFLIDNTENVIEDLIEYEAVLVKLEEEGVRWHMQVDF